MVKLPKLYMKTPIRLEYVKEDEYEIEVQSRIDVCVYENDKKYDVVFIKNVLFDDGYEDSFLMKYSKGLIDLDEVDDLCEEVISSD